MTDDDQLRQGLAEAFGPVEDVDRARRHVHARVQRIRQRRTAVAAMAVAGSVVAALVVLTAHPVGSPPVIGPVPEPTPVEPTGVPTSEATAGRIPDLPAGTTAEPAPWQLTAMTPDGRHLAVQLDWPECGVRLHAVEVTETATSVDVDVQASVPTGASNCAEPPLDELARDVALERPLGSRTLTGCRPDQPAQDCRQADEPPQAGGSATFTQPIMTTTELVLVSTSGLTAYEMSDGDQRWERPELADVSALQPAGGLLIGRRAGDRIIALDAATGETVWDVFEESYGPHDLHVGDNIVVVPDRVSFTLLHAIDPATGDLAWRYEAVDASAITAIVPHNTDDMVLAHVRGPDESSGRIVVLDQTTGQEQRSFDVPAGDLIGTDGGRIVFDVAGPQLIVYDTAGNTVLTASHPDGRVTAVLPGTAIIQGDRTLAAVDLADGNVAWERETHEQPPRHVQEGVLLTQKDNALTAIDVDTGDMRFVVDTRELPASAGRPPVLAAASINTLFAVTGDGELAWWHHVPRIPTAPKQ